MFCKNCGAPVNPGQEVCLNCGVKNGEGVNFCQNCGAQLPPNAAVCLNCGFASVVTSNKEKLVAGLLAIFLGQLGIHNFYLGYTKKAVAQLLICLLGSWMFGLGPAVSWIWAIVEGIKIFQGEIPDSDGKPLK